MGRILRSLVLLGVALSAAADFNANCPQGCRCSRDEYWKKEVECSHANLHEIPGPLSAETKILNLRSNNLTEIKSHAFVQLVNLRELTLRDCKLSAIQKNGLSGLASLIYLSLSHNQLTTLQPDTFSETVNVKLIDLSHNLLEKLDDGLFNNLPFLEIVRFYNNKITQVGQKTFLNVPKLSSLVLTRNKLEYMNTDTLSSLNLKMLHVHENPWRCDCNLQAFINWFVGKKISFISVTCTEPANLQGKQWDELTSSDFDCPSSTVNQNASTTLLPSDTNVNLNSSDFDRTSSTVNANINTTVLPSV